MGEFWSRRPATGYSSTESELVCDGVSLAELAHVYGTPAYIYSARGIQEAYREFASLVPGEVRVSVKACSNLSLLKLLVEQGAGFDVVSGGELERVITAGGDPAKIVFAGVGKSDAEIRQALELGIQLLNVESVEELQRISHIATESGLCAPVAIRVNPDVDPRTHKHISTGRDDHKFGIPIEIARSLFQRKLPGIDLCGLDCHIGSLIGDIEIFRQAFAAIREMVADIRSFYSGLKILDIGGGLGISYTGKPDPNLADYSEVARDCLADLGCKLLFEPGRRIFAHSGALLTQVVFTKESNTRRFVILDAGMNDLIRPALYDAYHEIEPVVFRESDPRFPVDIVGPICETSDCFARAREIPEVVRGDLLVIRSAGAYGFVMSSNYNSRPRPAEILVQNGSARIIRPRETIDAMLQSELECL